MSRRTLSTAGRSVSGVRARLGQRGTSRRLITLAIAVALALVLGALGGAVLYLLLAAL